MTKCHVELLPAAWQDVDHTYNAPFCGRRRLGHETRVLSPVMMICYTNHGSVRYTTETVEVSGGAV